ncbi:uncharacterized protein LOC142527138 [Primulina tabacum]|uniref:uncharacterized protein LOC142527138 n=1 Tax=Primulina tabacum TaxID=48773 RepID=UPI003F5916E0
MMKISSDEKMADSGEESSSWTFYIQGFMRDDDKNSTLSSDYETPSLLSDAASSAVKKSVDDVHGADTKLGFPDGTRGNGNDNDNYNNMGRNTSIMCKQNSFKKQKTKVPAAVMDYDLEDTASSPANSPKISYMNEFMNHKEKGKADVSQGKRMIFGKGGALSDHHVEKESNFADLKKRTCDY